MVRAMKDGYGNPSSLYQLGVDAEKAVKAARRQVLEAAGRQDMLDQYKAEIDVLME